MRASKHTPGPMLDTLGRRNRSLADRTCPECGGAFRPLRASSVYCSRPCARKKNGGHNRKPDGTWWVNAKGYRVGRLNGRHLNAERAYRRGYRLSLSDEARAARAERMRQMRRAAIAKATGQ